MDPQALIISRGKYAVRRGVAAVRVLVALPWLLLASSTLALTVQEAATLRAAPPLAESNKTADSLKRYQAAPLLAHRLGMQGRVDALLAALPEGRIDCDALLVEAAGAELERGAADVEPKLARLLPTLHPAFGHACLREAGVTC